MGNVFFICGPHCSGKTSIIKRLYKEGVISYAGDEIGKRLYYNRKLITDKQNSDFELEVTQMELTRDASLDTKNQICCIETWHPGNLAYAAVRNPDFLPKLLEECKKSRILNDVWGISLRVPVGKIAQRTQTFSNKREWAEYFYREIDKKLDFCIDLLDLKSRTTEIISEDNIENVYQLVKNEIENKTTLSTLRE
jgi:nicotinamide riboside kinase